MRDVNLSVILTSGLVWIPVAIWIYLMVSWMIMTEIDAITGTIGITFALVIGVLAFTHQNEKFHLLLIVGAWTALGVFPLVRYVSNRRELVKIDVDALERAYEILKEKPGNLGATIKVAKCLAARQLYTHASAIADNALREVPRDSFAEELRMARQWRAMTRPDQFHPIACAQCATLNQPGEVFCRKCNAPFLLLYAKGAWLGADMVRKLVVAWIAMLAVVVGIPVTFGALQPPISYIAAIALVVGAGLVAVLTFVPTKASTKT